MSEAVTVPSFDDLNSFRRITHTHTHAHTHTHTHPAHARTHALTHTQIYTYARTHTPRTHTHTSGSSILNVFKVKMRLLAALRVECEMRPVQLKFQLFVWRYLNDLVSKEKRETNSL